MRDAAFWGLDVSSTEGIAVVTPSGDLDLDTSPSVVEAARQQIAAGARRVVVNLSRVTFLDSSGVGALVTLWRTIGATPGAFAIASPSRAAQTVLETTGINSLLDHTETPA